MEIYTSQRKKIYVGRIIYGAVVGLLMSLPIIGAITIALLSLRYLAFFIDLNNTISKANSNSRYYYEQDIRQGKEPLFQYEFGKAIACRKYKILWFLVGFLPVKLYFWFHPFLAVNILANLIRSFQ